MRDQTGDRLTPTHAAKAGRRHRYYVSNRLIAGGPDPTGWRLPAARLERAVADLVAGHLETALAAHRLCKVPDLRGAEGIINSVTELVGRLRQGETDGLRALLRSGSLAPERIDLHLDRNALAGALTLSVEQLAEGIETITASLRLRRRGVEAKLVIGERKSAPDPVLFRSLSEAHRWTRSLRAGTPLGKVARDAGHHEVLIRTRGQFAFLSPKIQAAIRDGTQPPDLTLKRIMRRPMPLDWADQDRFYGV